jgi:hypothetical protein
MGESSHLWTDPPRFQGKTSRLHEEPPHFKSNGDSPGTMEDPLGTMKFTLEAYVAKKRPDTVMKL